MTEPLRSITPDTHAAFMDKKDPYPLIKLYLGIAHTQILMGTIFNDRKYVLPCGLEAEDEIARRFVQIYSKKPAIFSVRGESDSSGNPKTLYPKMFEGKRSWGGHTVCVLDGMVYDPFASDKPIPLDSYSEVAFGEPVIMTEKIASDDIEEHLRKKGVL